MLTGRVFQKSAANLTLNLPSRIIGSCPKHIRAVHSGGGGGGSQRGQLPPLGKLNFFSNIVFEFAELFLVGCSKTTRKSTN